ncbi:protein kinase [candidate division KSB1 bacterium]|nr:protein kinase [candidate division KSB1 bacterium]
MVGRIISHYKIINKLGEGGMGQVYLVEDLRLERKVALKFLPSQLTTDKHARERFEREAKAAAALNHPNIITIYDVSEFEGQTYIAMEYVDGVSLRERIFSYADEASRISIGRLSDHTKDAGFNIATIINIAIQICAGLSTAHGAGIVHRDIKPENIFIDAHDVVKILDFGIAKLKDSESETATMGTLAYMSPEQIYGTDADFYTDIWSCGVVLYEMATLRLPFREEYESALLYSIINQSPLPPTKINEEIPSELEKIILKCLEKEPQNRYSSARMLAKELKKCERVVQAEQRKAAAPQTEKPGIHKETERRLATVLFAEIVGYTEMLQRLEAEDAASIMNSCFATFTFVVEKYGAKIAKALTNNLVVLFGVPVAIEEASKEAVNTAIEMHNQLYQLNEDLNLTIPLDIRVGINTGIVITGTMAGLAHNDYNVMGDTVNLASQLKDLAEKGQILIGPLTYKYTKNEFDYRPARPIFIKGEEKAVSIYELLSTKEKIYRPIIDLERMIYSEMVGRDKELDKLELHVLKVINGEGSIVNIIGEAGVGKSRLLAELCQNEKMLKVTLFSGRALSIGKNLSFHPIIDLLKNWAGIKDDDSSYASGGKLENAIRTIDPERGAEIYPFVATLMGLKLTGLPAERIKGIEGSALEKLIFKNVRELVSKAAEQKAIAFIIEDVHWSDRSSIELIESLFQLANNSRVLFINVFRPNYQETGERLLKTIKSKYNDIYTEILLESLDKNQSVDLINNLLKTKMLPAHVGDLITRRAEGNPFFIEEIVRSFIDDEIIIMKDGRFKATQKMNSVVIPETITDVLMARIDKLDEDTRSLLKVASVIGRNFFYKILTQVAKNIEEIDDRLDYLKGVQLIKEQQRMEEIEYLFKHALAQEAVYNSILSKKRKELHLHVARSIESVFSEKLHEFFGMLAFHFSLGENQDKAEEYMEKAGEEALKSSASNEALHYYQEALTIYLNKHGSAADPQKIAMLEKNIAIAFFNKGQYVEAVDYFDKALAYYGEKIPHNPLLKIYKFTTGFMNFLVCLYFPALVRVKEPTMVDKEIISLYEKKTRALSSADPKRMFIETFFWLKRLTHSKLTEVEGGVGLFGLLSGLFSFSGISFKMSGKILEYVKDKTKENDLRSVLYYKFAELLHDFLAGSWADFSGYDETLINKGLNAGEIWAAINIVFFSGVLRIEQGSFADAQATIDKLIECGSLYEDDFSITTSYLIKIRFLFKYRKLTQALVEADKGIAFFENIGYNAYAFELYSFKARAYLLRGEISNAEKTLQRADKLRIESNPVPMTLIEFLKAQLSYDIYRLEYAIQTKDQKEFNRIRASAAKNIKNIVKISHKVAPEHTESMNLVGVYCWLDKKPKTALRWWNKSIQYGEKIGATLEIARVYMQVGRRLLEKGSPFHELNSINAEKYLEMAKSLFQKMEMQWDLYELEKITNELKRTV